jgi:putative ABC transport system permease protein
VVSVLSLAWRTIQGRKAGFVAAFVAVFCGAALITACGVLVDSGLRAGIPPQRYAAAPVVVAADQTAPVSGDTAQRFAERVPLPAADVDRIARVPGVRTAVGDVSVTVGVLAPGHGLLGGAGDTPVLAHGWSSAVLGPVAIAEGRAPGAPDEVVLDNGLAARAAVRPGATVDLVVGGVPTRYRVVGIATAGGRQAAVFVTDEQARLVAGRPDQVDTVGVLADPGVTADQLAERIGSAVPGVRTYTGNTRADAESLDVGQARAFLTVLAGAFGGTMLMIVLLVVSGTLGLAIQQRYREFALLRAIAATPRQIHRLIGAETVLVSSAAAVLGALPGYGLSVLLRNAIASAGAIPPDFDFAIDPLPAVVAVVSCVLMARLAGLIVARRAARISPIEALGEAAVEPPRLGRVRLLVGWLLVPAGLAAGVALPLLISGPAATAGAASSALLLVIAVALLGPRLLTATAALLGRLGWGRVTVGGFLAGANTRANARRLSSATTPLIMGVALAAVQIFTMTTMTAAAQRQADTGVLADRVLTGTPNGIAPSIAATVRRVPGVAVVTPVARTQVVVSYRAMGNPAAGSYSTQGVTPDRLGTVLDLDVRHGDLAGLTGNTVALSQSAADTFGVGVGGTVAMHLGDGTPITPRVVAVYGSGLGFGDVTLPHDVVVAHTTSRLDTVLLVGVAPHADLGAVDTALRAAIRPYPTVGVTDRAAFTAAQDAALVGQNTVSLVLNLVLLGYIAIAVVNTLVLATAARAREFALLRLVGATRRQVRAMLRGEARIVIVAAIGLGSLTALPPLVGISIGQAGTALPTVPPLAYLGILAVAIGLGWCSITVPARFAMRPKPVDAIGTRE